MLCLLPATMLFADSFYTVSELMSIYESLSLESGSTSSDSYTVRGYITYWKSGYPSWQNGDFFIDDDANGSTTLLECFRLTAPNEEDQRTLIKGEYVEATGYLKNYGGRAELVNGTYSVLSVSEPAINLGEKTITEFLSLKNYKDTCILTGVVANIVMDDTDPTQYKVYGNFDLVELGDPSTKVYIYGLLTADKNPQQFRTMGVDAGDTLTIKAIYSEYNSNPQVANAIYVSHRDYVEPTPDPIDYNKTEVDFATDFAAGWTGWIGKTLTFTNDFYVNDVSTPTASYIRLRSLEEYGDDNDNTGVPTDAYNKAVEHNTWANCTLSGISFNYKERPGIIIRGLQATVTEANKLQVVNSPTIIKNDLPTERPDLNGANVVVCGTNIENFFVTLGGYAGAANEEKLEIQKSKISKGLYHINADIYAICEMEQGPAAVPVMVDLLNNLAGKEQYDWVNAGFESADAIMVCFIYRKDKMAPVGDYLMPYSSTSSPYHYRMGIQCFQHLESGEKFNISINHFKAKGSSATDSQRQTNMNMLINYGLKSSSVLANDPDMLVLGDLNAYTNEESNLYLSRDQHYVDLLMKYDPQGYSYVHNNTVGYLDHAYCNASMAGQVTKAVPYHLNADTYYQYAYSKEGSSVTAEQRASMYRYADHDPILVGLYLGDKPTAIENVNVAGQARKEIRNGQIVILRGDQIFTVTGQRVK